MRIPLVVQHRHIHLSLQDQKKLFCDEELLSQNSLGHYSQFVSNKTLDVHGSSGFLKSVRVLGPGREQTQVELSPSEALAVGISAPVRLSGDTTRAGGCILKSEKEEIRVPSCVIIPARHIHLSERTAKKLEVQQGQIVSVECLAEPFTRVDHVSVRVHPTFADELHLTSDEVAEYWLHDGDLFKLCDIISSS